MSTVLARQRCWTHAQREAVSRCPSCRKFYCRECVTEHDGRLLCVQCLAAGTRGPSAHAGTRWALLAAMAVLGVLVSFVAFYTAGYVLQQLPPAWTRGAEVE